MIPDSVQREVFKVCCCFLCSWFRFGSDSMGVERSWLLLWLPPWQLSRGLFLFLRSTDHGDVSPLPTMVTVFGSLATSVAGTVMDICFKAFSVPFRDLVFRSAASIDWASSIALARVSLSSASSLLWFRCEARTPVCLGELVQGKPRIRSGSTIGVVLPSNQ